MELRSVPLDMQSSNMVHVRLKTNAHFKQVELDMNDSIHSALENVTL